MLLMKKLFLVISLLLVASWSFATLEQMPGSHYVQDYAKVFTYDQRQTLENKLAMTEDSAAVQIAVVSVNYIPDNTDIDTYATDIFTEWGIGVKGTDNGLLILFSVGDRQVVMRTGYGTEAVLTDALCSQIIRHKISPAFMAKDYYKGIDEATDDVYSIVKGEFSPEELGYGGSDEVNGLYVLAFLILVFVLPLFLPPGMRSAYYSFLLSALLRGGRGGGGSSGRSFGGGSTGGGGARGSW